MRLRDRTPLDEMALNSLAFEALLEQVPDVLYVMEASELRFMRLSKAAVQAFGTEDIGDSASQVGKSPEEIFDPETARMASSDTRAIIETGQPVIGLVREIRFPNGAAGYGSLSVFPIRDEEGAVVGVVGVNRDITKFQLSQVELEARAERLESALDRVEPARVGADAIAESICRRALDLTSGVSAVVYLLERGGLAGRATAGAAASITDDSLTLAERVLAANARMTEPVPGGAPEDVMTVAVPLRRGDDPTGVLVVQGQDAPLARQDVETVELLALVLSSSLSHAAEVAALERFRAVFEGTSIGIARLRLDGTPIETNPALQRMLGYSTGIPLNHDFHSAVVHPDDREKAAALFTQLMSGEIDEYQFDVRLLRSMALADSDAFLWCELRATVERDALGQPANAILMIEDMTERRRVEEALLRTQKLEAIGQLTAGVAHEFNNLLMGVLGYARLAQTRTDEPEVSPLLDKLVHAAERAAQLTKQLLTYGRRQSLNRVEVDLTDRIRETVSMLRQLVGERYELIADLQEEVWGAMVDETQLEQLLLNLTLNARDAMPEGGRIRFSTENVHVEPGTHPQLSLAPGDYVALAVRDTGVGMTEEVKGRAFEPFFTTKNVGQGSGLGLSSVYGMARQHLGEVELETEAGVGTVVTVYLPASGAAVSTLPSRGEAQPSVAGCS